ncbi:GyrI-like domain-containing protein [Flavisericum labens]|uniref:GyrI-like domain-containing protein n=1 Tax=Flavisericum labens TaxID=3377112 RepID=UPI00387B6878
MKKIILSCATIILLVFMGWYFFVKDYNYRITFKTHQAPGIIYSALLGWNNGEPLNKKVVSTTSKVPFSELNQELNVSDSIIDIKWSIERKSDSVTKVTAFLKDAEHSLFQKFKIPFTKTDFVKRSLTTVKHIREGLKTHQTEYKLSSVEEAIFPEVNCAYITLSCKLNEKAKLMIAHTIDVMNYLRDNNLELKGDPFLEVTEWNLNEDLITFDFCFPIAKQYSYPESKLIKIKTIKEKKALRTIFNGNYRISDRGWFTLLDYADRNNIEIDNNPIEVFLNDPHSGGVELEWEAEIYLPVRTKL